MSFRRFKSKQQKSIPFKNKSKFRQQEDNFVVIDTDAGTDDAWGLFMALRAHQDALNPLRILAITTTHGNTTVDNVTVNVTRTLQTVDESGIPVYRGASAPLTVPLILDGPPYHGRDGFGDADLPPVEPVLAAGHAVTALLSLAEQYPGAITVLALGPLTNLALAIRLNPEVNFKQIFIMGGNYEGLGNTTPGGEFNFLSDGEAARTTLENYTCPILVAPWETCLRFGTTTKVFRTDDLGTIPTPQVELLNAIEANILESTPTDEWNVPDPVPVALLINPAFGTKTEEHYCTVELNGEHTRGMMVVDRNGFLERPPNVTILTEFDSEIFKEMLRWAAGGSTVKAGHIGNLEANCRRQDLTRPM